MAEGIDQIKVVMGSALEVVNAQQKLAKVDWKLVAKQVLDLDEAEAHQIAADFKVLDLNDDEFEGALEGYVDQGGNYAATILRMIRVFFPKK